MLFVFFDIQGIIMTQYVPPGQTMNQTYYIEKDTTYLQSPRNAKNQPIFLL
jgi:hypothetical protein